MHDAQTAHGRSERDAERPALRDSDAVLLRNRMIALSARLTDEQLEELTLALVREMRGRRTAVPPRRLDMRL